jgi:integrase
MESERVSSDRLTLIYSSVPRQIITDPGGDGHLVEAGQLDIAVNVAASVKPPRKQHGDSQPKIIWKPEVLIKFRALADQDEWAAGWRLTLCGLRRSEVLGMRWDAIDMEG